MGGACIHPVSQFHINFSVSMRGTAIAALAIACPLSQSKQRLKNRRRPGMPLALTHLATRKPLYIRTQVSLKRGRSLLLMQSFLIFRQILQDIVREMKPLPQKFKVHKQTIDSPLPRCCGHPPSRGLKHVQRLNPQRHESALPTGTETRAFHNLWKPVWPE